MTRKSACLVVCLAAATALSLCAVAAAKGGLTTTTCGRDRCRTSTDVISGIATLPGHVRTPRLGRYYTISLQMKINGRSDGWKVVYEARRQIVRAADLGARSFLGTRWLRLAPDVQDAYSLLIRGLAPMRSAPRSVRQAGG